MEPDDFFEVAAKSHYHHDYNYRWWRYKEISLRCESPIEQYLAAAMMFCTCPGRGPERLPEWRLDPAEDISYLDKDWPSYLVITPQAQIAGHRVDFLITMRTDGGKSRDVLVVECDGHDFHERTKEQASRDKSRDRNLVLNGLRVMRFTGSELFRDPDRCATEVFNVLHNIWEDGK